MPVLNFKDSSSIYPKIRRTDLKLMLWAGDTVYNNISDIQRLSGYDVYICNGYTQGLDENIKYMNSLANSGEIYLCLININEKCQMNQFVKVFGEKFSVIDSDYHGNTPSLPVEYYSDLLMPGGIAYNTEGINSIRMPMEEYLNTLELFAPLLTNQLKMRRYYTMELINEAKDNNITPAEAWSSPDLKQSYYDGLRSRQEKFLENQCARSPSYKLVYNYNVETLEKYWDTLPLEILISPLETLPSDFGTIEPHLQRFALYLRARAEKPSNHIDENSADSISYIQTHTILDELIYKCQKILKYRMYSEKFISVENLKVHLKYYIDQRYTGSPRRVYGVIISKI